MNFAEAVKALKQDKAMCRKSWKNIDFVVMMPALKLPPFSNSETFRKVNDRTAKWIGEHRTLDCQPYLACCKIVAGNAIWTPGWLASQSDLLADDWQEYVLEKL